MSIYSYAELIENSPTDEEICTYTGDVIKWYEADGLTVTFSLDRLYRAVLLWVNVDCPADRPFRVHADGTPILAKVDGNPVTFLVDSKEELHVCNSYQCQPHLDAAQHAHIKADGFDALAHDHPVTIDSFHFAGEDKVGQPPYLPTPA